MKHGENSNQSVDPRQAQIDALLKLLSGSEQDVKNISNHLRTRMTELGLQFQNYMEESISLEFARRQVQDYKDQLLKLQGA